MLHHNLTVSRMVTLRGAFRHGGYLTAGSSRLGSTVDTYLTTGTLPLTDTAC